MTITWKAMRRVVWSVDWLVMTGVLLAGFLCGWGAAGHFARAPLDSGLATLLGSALGAGITVVGAIWVARYQASAHHRAFERFAGDAVAAIRDEAYVLIALTEMKGFESNQLEAAKLRGQVDRLKEALAMFVKNVTVSRFASYDVQLWMNRLEKEVADNLRTLDKEIAWLGGTLSDAVLANARGDLSYAASQTFEACVGAMRELQYERGLPDQNGIIERVAVFQ